MDCIQGTYFLSFMALNGDRSTTIQKKKSEGSQLFAKGLAKEQGEISKEMQNAHILHQSLP